MSMFCLILYQNDNAHDLETSADCAYRYAIQLQEIQCDTIDQTLFSSYPILLATYKSKNV